MLLVWTPPPTVECQGASRQEIGADYLSDEVVIFLQGEATCLHRRAFIYFPDAHLLVRCIPANYITMRVALAGSATLLVWTHPTDEYQAGSRAQASRAYQLGFHVGDFMGF